MQVSPWPIKYRGRLPFLPPERRNRLVSSPTCLQRDYSLSRTTRCRPVCHEIHFQSATFFYSWKPNPEALATDPFAQTWKILGYAHPPWCLIGKVLAKVSQEQATLILITPLWKGQSWFPVLTTMLVDYPVFFPNRAEVLSPSPHCDCPVRQLQVQLVAWKVSEDISRQEEFLKGSSPLSLPHGGRRLVQLKRCVSLVVRYI